jgi:hypothetical protein
MPATGNHVAKQENHAITSHEQPIDQQKPFNQTMLLDCVEIGHRLTVVRSRGSMLTIIQSTLTAHLMMALRMIRTTESIPVNVTKVPVF